MKSFIYSALLFFSFCAVAKSQVTMHKLVSAGYTYQNSSFGEVGGKLLFLSNDDVVFRTGLSALMGSVNHKFAIMPKIQVDFLFNFERNVDLYHSYYFVAGAEATNKYIAPKVGVSLFGIVDLMGGYGFSLNKSGINGKELKGFKKLFLKKGETQSVSFTLTATDLKFYNDEVKLINEAGDYELFVGNSSDANLKSKFKLTL